MREVLGNVEVNLDGDVTERLHGAMMRLHGPRADGKMQWTSRARRTIHENADGSIEVTVRRGGDELVSHYTNADDLAARDPQTYDRYLEMIEADPE